MFARGEPRATYLFKTREGGMGILQIVGFTGDPPGVKIRYKMVESAPATGGGEDAPGAARAERVEGMANVAEGPVLIHTPIHLPLRMAEPEADEERRGRQVLAYPVVEFRERGDGLQADLRMKCASWPHTYWRVDLALLTSEGKHIAGSGRMFGNSGTIEMLPREEEATEQFPFAGIDGLDRARRFRLTLQTAWTGQSNPCRLDEEIPLSLEFSGDRYRTMLRANSMKLSRLGDAVRATVNAGMLSGPKQAWRFILTLYGPEGRAIGEGSQVLENSGLMVGRPGWQPVVVSIGVPIAGGDPSAIRRYDLRVAGLEQTFDMYDLAGTVSKLEPLQGEVLSEALSRIAAAQSQEEVADLLKGMLGADPEPARNAVVTLRGESVTRQAVADAQGQFRFLFLPRAVYELSAEMPAQGPGMEAERMATSPTRVNLDRYRRQGLMLRADLVLIEGRVTDADGRPVAGAKVTATEVIDEQSSEFLPASYTTLSRADGSYQLPGLEPPNIYRIAGYLNGGTFLNLRPFDIHVEAAGFVQPKENVPRVPLVTGEQLDRARRLLEAFSQMATRSGSDDKIGEKEGRASFPSSQGNAITGIDIVLNPADEGKQ